MLPSKLLIKHILVYIGGIFFSQLNCVSVLHFTWSAKLLIKVICHWALVTSGSETDVLAI